MTGVEAAGTAADSEVGRLKGCEQEIAVADAAPTPVEMEITVALIAVDHKSMTAARA